MITSATGRHSNEFLSKLQTVPRITFYSSRKLYTRLVKQFRTGRYSPIFIVAVLYNFLITYFTSRSSRIGERRKKKCFYSLVVHHVTKIFVQFSLAVTMLTNGMSRRKTIFAFFSSLYTKLCSDFDSTNETARTSSTRIVHLTFQFRLKTTWKSSEN